jgi:hypothetical protein
MKWFVWKRLLLGSTNQSIIARRVGCSKQYVHKVCGELIAQGILTKSKKNRVELLDSRKLLFKLAAAWSMPEPLVIDLPLRTREEISDYLRKQGINHAFTLRGLSAWVDDAKELEKYQGRKGFFVYANPKVVRDRKADDVVDDVQLFCDLFSRGGVGIDLALNHCLKTGLL